MAISEIEKLERRYAENPHGLTFAPLAELYRKSGDVTRALELLGAGVERHPEYIPARIVLGRCHLDLGAVAEAEEAFTCVLALDGENVIALKALADIGERMARLDDAERWLQTLLSIDRNNEAAREQLTRIETARQEAESVADGGAHVSPEAEVASVDLALPDVVPEEALAADGGIGADLAPSSEEPSATPMPEVIATVETMAEATAASGAEPLVLEEPTVVGGAVIVEGLEHDPQAPTLEGPAAPLPGLVRPGTSSLGKEPGRAEEEFRVETADDLVLRPSSASEFQMPDPSQELVAAKPDPDPLGGIGFDELTASAAVPESEPDSEPSPAADPPAALQLAPVPEGTPFAASAVSDDSDRAASELPVIPVVATADESSDAVVVPIAAQPVPGETDALVVDVAAADAPVVDAPVADVSLIDVAVDDAAANASRSEATEAELMAASATNPEVIASGNPAPESPTAAVVGAAGPEAAPLIVTETMADVLLQQGYTADALRIYRELERRNPADLRLRDKRAALESESAPAVPAASSRRSYAARGTGGRTLGAFLRDLVGARLPAPPAVPPRPASTTVPGAGRVPVAVPVGAPAAPGAPTRPAADTLSLSAVFGDDASPVPPAVSAASGAPKNGVSFDEFFGVSGARRAVPPRAPEPKADEDLDQFHAWLQNLKR